jgi:protein TonB
MKILFFIAFLTLVEILYSQNTNENENQEEIVLIDSDIPASFPGGDVELLKYIRDNLKYPDTCIALGSKGRVFLKFVVEPDGSITNIEVEKNLTGCDQFAIACMELLSSMPKWIPGESGGVKDRIKYRLPIIYNPSKQ